jgi:hypothetical protein
MKLLIMQLSFSPASCHFIFLWSKLSAQYHVLKHPSSPLNVKRTSYNPIQNYRQNCGFVNFLCFYIADKKIKGSGLQSSLLLIPS